MKVFLFMISVAAVVGLAFWAYSENYKTKAALDDMAQLQRDIGHLRDTRSVLRAEWAYLNRPDRLRDLALLNFERLKLVPITPDHFARIEHVAYPSPDLPPITGTTMVSGPLKNNNNEVEQP
ncbi:MAG: cell division protein FtsL [Pseudomonadota bacterium]